MSYHTLEGKTIHIASGEANAGAIRFSLGGHNNQVIGFPELFAVGPIWELHMETGRIYRNAWLQDFLDTNELEVYKEKISSVLEELNEIPRNVPLVLWTADNADEQTGLRYLLYMLRELVNPIYIIDTAKAYEELFNTEENKYSNMSTGAIEPERLKQIYKGHMKGSPITYNERTRLNNEWLDLSKTKETLRIWNEGEVIAVAEDYYDELIIHCVRKSEVMNGEEYLHVGQLISIIYGELEYFVNDMFLMKRINALVACGILLSKGNKKSITKFHVKLN